MAKRVMIALLALILLFAAAPVLSVIVASTISSSAGCALDEGSIHPCIVFGRDIGSLLYTLGVAGRFALATIPIGALAVWLGAAIVLRIMQLRRA